jgi:hypothetical protein
MEKHGRDLADSVEAMRRKIGKPQGGLPLRGFAHSPVGSCGFAAVSLLGRRRMSRVSPCTQQWA